MPLRNEPDIRGREELPWRYVNVWLLRSTSQYVSVFFETEVVSRIEELTAGTKY
jgi:hypothetical protein